MAEWSEVHTTGIRQDMAAKAADDTTMMTKTTHNVFLPSLPMSCSTGRSGRTVGTGSTGDGVDVGMRVARVVFIKTSTGSIIMAFASVMVLAAKEEWL